MRILTAKLAAPVMLTAGDTAEIRYSVTMDMDSPDPVVIDYISLHSGDPVTYNTISTTDTSGAFYPSTNTPFYTSPSPPPSSSQICSICGAKVEMNYTNQHNTYHQNVNSQLSVLYNRLNKLDDILTKIADIDGLTLGDLVGCEEQGQV